MRKTALPTASPSLTLDVMEIVMRRYITGKLFLFGLVWLGSLAAWPLCPLRAQNTSAAEGADLVFGGPGSEPGKFLELRDLAFDPQGHLYTLDGARYDAKTHERTGNLRVQKYSDAGKLLATIDLRDEATGSALGVTNDPQRLAVDGKGMIYVTLPAAGRVHQFAADGKFVRSIDLPSAMAITRFGGGDKERLAVVPSTREVVKGKWQSVGGDRVVILTSAGAIERTVPLAVEKPLEKVLDLAADAEGRFYIQAEPNAIYQFSAQGKLLKTLGGNPTTRNEDGSEVLHTVAVDSKGNVYTYAWGNPGMVTRFNADGATVTQRGGQFQFADPWSMHSNYTILAVDPSDRLWVGVTHLHRKNNPNYAHYRAAPAVVRTKVDFFDKPAGAVKQTPTRILGFKPELHSNLTYNVAYQPGQEVTMSYRIAPANRSAKEAAVHWLVFDAAKKQIAEGKFVLPLTNGQEPKATFSFKLPRFGSYFVLAKAQSPEGALVNVAEHLGVTPAWPGMPVLKEGEAKDSWEDAPRQMWSGLPNMRLHPGKNFEKMDKIDEDLKLAEKLGATVLVQLVDSQKNFKAAHVQSFMERFRGRVQLRRSVQ